VGVQQAAQAQNSITLLNVSYDPTREFYRDYNRAFATYWKKTAGQNVRVRQSHGGSGKQARAVVDGLKADVVTLALAYDVNALAKARLTAPNWYKRLPGNASPYTSTIVFLVRKGNPKGIRDWNDLVRPGVQVITPNPKTSGGARWNYLAAWGYAQKKKRNPRQFVQALYRNVPVLDSGARGSTTTFVNRGIGDVLLAWENEAYLATRKLSPGQFQIVVPSLSILAEPPVAVVDRNVARNGNARAANAYLKYLYSPVGQQLAAKHFYRPRNAAYGRGKFGRVNLFNINAQFGGWEKAQKAHFVDGAIFDQISRR
jgi:sulfate transport system substrate-binding protein